jgi:HK97 family phage prohead protease
MVERFAGYAAVFDRADRSGDVIRPGAFGGVGPVPLYWQHGPRGVAGVIEAIGEDAKGLRVIGRATGVAPGMGLSFGYRVRRMSGRTNRQLEALDLVEVSLVRTPMQPLARVHAVETFEAGE